VLVKLFTIYKSNCDIFAEEKISIILTAELSSWIGVSFPHRGSGT
jgi:hypothetical protein